MSVEQTTAFELIADTATFGAFLDVQHAIVDEARWQTDAEALHMAAVDAANVCMVTATLAPEACEHYTASGGLVGLNLARLDDFVTTGVGSDDLARLALDTETRKLHVDRGATDYDLALISPEDIRQEPDLPDLDLPARATTDGETLENAVKSVDLVSDHLDIVANPEAETVTISASGDTDRAATTLEADDLFDVTWPGEPTRSRFSIDYFKEIVDPMPKAAEVALAWGQDHPIKLEYDIGEGDIEVVNLVAPRIDSSLN